MRYEGLRELVVEVSRERGRKPKIAVFGGSKFATSTPLSARILRMFQAIGWPDLPAHTARWLALQRQLLRLPEPGRLLVETFLHEGRTHLVAYGFAGRNTMQTLGILLTKQMEDATLNPLGFVATDYVVMIWGLEDVSDPARLFDLATRREGLGTCTGGLAATAPVLRGLMGPGSRAILTGRQALAVALPD